MGKPRRKKSNSALPGDAIPADAPSEFRATLFNGNTRRSLLGAAIVVAAVLVAYIPAIQGGFIWDDDDYVTDNVNLRSLEGLGKIWFDIGATHQYYPLVHTSFWIEYHLWEYRPAGYHAVNVVLHALAALLLWCVLARLSVPGAWLAASVFAVHPVHVESVAWITERKNVLSGVFYFAALLSYLRFAGIGCKMPATNRSRFYAASLALFLCALLSKTVTCSLPAAILLLLWWKRDRLRLRDVWPLVPMFVLGAGLGLLTAWMEKHSVGAEGIDWTLTFAERCLVAGRVIWFYAGKLLWPAQLTFIYPRWTIDGGVWWQCLFPLAALAVVVMLFALRSRVGKGPLVAALFFGGTLFPALGFIDVYPMRFSFVADHFQYLASAGPITVMAALLMLVLRRPYAQVSAATPSQPAGRSWLAVIPAAWLILLAALTWRQGPVYKDRESLWRDTIAKNPDAWIAYNNLGIVLDEQGKHEEAAKQYYRALEARSDFPDAHNNLGRQLVESGRVEEGIEHYRKALAIRPDYAEVYLNLGKALAKLGRLSEAADAYEQCLALDSESKDAHAEMGVILARQGDVAAGIKHQRQALALDPTYALACNNLAIISATQGKVDEAIGHFKEAVRLQPDLVPALNGLSRALTIQGQGEEALTYWREAVQRQPDNVEVRCALGDYLMTLGRFEEAASEYTAALRIAPGSAPALAGLDRANSQLNR